MKSDSRAHAHADSLQALLEGTLSPRDEARVRRHLEGCGRCRSELEGWTLLFRELDALPEIIPPEGFRREVLAAVGRRRPLRARLAAGLCRLLPTSSSTGAHVPAERLQDHLDGVLAGPGRRSVERHLAACRSCARGAAAWRSVLGALDELPALSPAAGFQTRVMAGIEPARARETAAASPRTSRAAGWRRIAARVGDIGSALAPSTRRGWAVLTGIAFTPTVALVTLTWAVAAHPLVTLDALRTFLGWKVAEIGAVTWSGVRESAVGNPLLFRGWELLHDVASTPGMALGVSLVLILLMTGSFWTLYRNLIGTPHPDAPHARPSP